jgi:hypothetical protein
MVSLPPSFILAVNGYEHAATKVYIRASSSYDGSISAQEEEERGAEEVGRERGKAAEEKEVEGLKGTPRRMLGAIMTKRQSGRSGLGLAKPGLS